MAFLIPEDNPFQLEISFHKVIEALEEIAESDVDYRAIYARGLLNEVNKVPELRHGIKSVNTIVRHEKLIRNLLSDLFPTALTDNEIKAVTIPFHPLAFNKSRRFQKILDDAGQEFSMHLRDPGEVDFYVMSCCIILAFHFGYKLDFSLPVFYDIPAADGSLKHYRVLYNGDFLEIFPTEKSVGVTVDDVRELLDNFSDVAFWKTKFPPGSWILRGFGIMTLFDATVENAVSLLKENLLLKKKEGKNAENIQEIFRSIFNLRDLRIGFTEFMADEDRIRPLSDEGFLPSYLVSCEASRSCTGLLKGKSIKEVMDGQKFLTISDVARYAETHPDDQSFADALLNQGVHSCIFVPIFSGEKLLGIMELVSGEAGALNSISANKLDFVLPFIGDTIERVYSERQNLIDAMIQKEYTSIHPSVYWKFREEAEAHIAAGNEDLPFNEIIFREVFPLYGQVDVKGSSQARNQAVREDLGTQLSRLSDLLRVIATQQPMPLMEKGIYELEQLRDELEDNFQADTEFRIQNVIQNEIHPILEHFRNDVKLAPAIREYRNRLDAEHASVYERRKDFDQTLSLINKRMAAVLDKRQEEAQRFFPHYYERFKTDGVEHNLYIGASIAPTLHYNPIFLENLRLWQLQVLCDLELEYYRLRPGLAFDLEVTSLLLVFSNPIAIRFRMDEKRFDVDGTYNARYEVVKKRIDKALIKNSEERISQPGRITIVFSTVKEEQEYMRYITLLQHKGRLGDQVERFEVADLQGVSGLKGLRVAVAYEGQVASSMTYDDLLTEFHIPAKD